MVFNRVAIVAGFKVPRVFPVLLFLTAINFYCFSSEKNLPGITGQGQISGTVVGATGAPILDVTVTTSFKGQTFSVKTDKNGKFSFTIPEVERGDGFTLAFSKTDFDSTNAAAVIKLPNLKVDIDPVTMMIRGSEGTVTRTITGQLYDNFSYGALKAANVSLTDASGQVIIAQTNDAGKFTLQSAYFPLNASYTLSVYKANYIPRTDLTVQISAEENTMNNSPARLYNRFGSVYVYVAEDTRIDTSTNKPYSVDNAAVTMLNSNNKLLTCITGVGQSPGGPYDAIAGVPNPLPVGKYCPDLSGITSPMSMALPYASDPARTNNSGGVKFQNDFLFIGTRYNVNVSKTSANCTSRSSAATQCYRSITTYVDMAITGDNPVSGQVVKLPWDAWIHGTTTGGAGVTVTLYTSSNTLIAQTTTDASGGFLFDGPSIVRDQEYKLTFEKTGYYSRRISFSNSGYQSRPGLRSTASDIITEIDDTSELKLGLEVTGHGILPGTTIINILNGTSIQISSTPSALSKTTLNFSPTPASRNGTRTLSSSTITGIGTTADLIAGLSVSGTGITAGTKINAILTGTSVGLSTSATASGTSALTFANIYQTPVVIKILNAGPNNTGSVPMDPLPPPTHCVRGTVRDYWSNSPVQSATVAINDGGWRTGTTGPAPAAGPIPALAAGEFYIQGNFSNTTVNAYDVEISKTGYTGSTQVAKQTFKFTHDGVASCPGTPYNIDSVNACGATSANETCVTRLVLHPLGIHGVINGSSRSFDQQVKQTYEKFLTEKNGLTISGRTGALQLTSGPQKNNDYHGIYLHFDNTPFSISDRPDTKWSNNVPVNPLPTKCTPTVTTNCSPRANGVITESIGNDNRIISWDIKTYTYYHFYAAAPGSYTVETTGSTDTKITLISQTGAVEGSDDDSGSGSNARIVKNLLRGWYYIKVEGKNNNVFGFFDVSVTGPTQAESNYSTMLSPAVESYQTISGSATYSTNCAPNNGNLVISWYDAAGHVLYVAAPGENGGCSVTATIEKHGPIGEIIRGRFEGSMRPIAPSGANATISGTLPSKGYFNIIRQE